MRRTFNRRSFLKMAGMTAAAAATPVARALAAPAAGRGSVNPDETISYNELYGNPPMLGRVEAAWLSIWDQPWSPAEWVARIDYDDVIPIYNSIRSEPYWSSPQNDVWYETDEGYVHSSYLVPCREVFHEPEDTIGLGFWGEITVPTSWQHWRPALDSRRYYDLAYGTVYWVKDRADDDEGRAWYRIVDDVEPNWSWWVQASHVRRIARSEFAPISPNVEDKRIIINLDAQHLTAYQNGIEIFETRVATGTNFTDEDGNLHWFQTARGDYAIQRKKPSRRMVGGAEADDFYDLPGVPWVSYFTMKGASIHGTYWHNDFGRPRSHGCINVTSDAAKWLYRWVTPYTGYDEEYYWTQPEDIATAIKII
jgi:hypothetical protein